MLARPNCKVKAIKADSFDVHFLGGKMSCKKKEFCVPSKEGAHYVYYLVANTLKALALAHVCLATIFVQKL